MRAQLMMRYILGEMIPTFLIGVIGFVLVLLMLQALRLTEFVLVHGVKLTTIAEMAGYMATSFLPILFPMSLLLTVLLTYGRLSADAEVVAFRAIGLNTGYIIAPAIILAVAVLVLSLQTSYHIAPWGNRQFESLISKLGSMKPGVAIKEGTFSEGFFDLVVYANKVDSSDGHLEQVFIFDERNQKAPVTVISRRGLLVQDKDHPGHRASLRLMDGDIHSSAEGRHTKIDFTTYEIFFNEALKQESNSKSPQSMTIEELGQLLQDPKLAKEQRLEVETERHKRTALGFACLVFGAIGAGIGTVSNRRNAKSGGTVIALALIVTYYILFVTAEGFARKGEVVPWLVMWVPNGLFSVAALWVLRRSWR
ncbi:MAG: LptF/LptG family permease [Bdellovibrionota bacterium]